MVANSKKRNNFFSANSLKFIDKSLFLFNLAGNNQDVLLFATFQTSVQWGLLMPHSVCYCHFGNEVCNGAISIMQLGLIKNRYKVNPVGQWGKILVMAMGFVDHFGPKLFDFRHMFIQSEFLS